MQRAPLAATRGMSFYPAQGSFPRLRNALFVADELRECMYVSSRPRRGAPRGRVMAFAQNAAASSTSRRRRTAICSMSTGGAVRRIAWTGTRQQLAHRRDPADRLSGSTP